MNPLSPPNRRSPGRRALGRLAECPVLRRWLDQRRRGGPRRLKTTEGSVAPDCRPLAAPARSPWLSPQQAPSCGGATPSRRAFARQLSPTRLVSRSAACDSSPAWRLTSSGRTICQSSGGNPGILARPWTAARAQCRPRLRYQRRTDVASRVEFARPHRKRASPSIARDLPRPLVALRAAMTICSPVVSMLFSTLELRRAVEQRCAGGRDAHGGRRRDRRHR